MNDQSIEKEIQTKGLTAPRVTPERIAKVIASEHYFTGLDGVIGGEMTAGQRVGDLQHHQSLGLLTFCILVLRNGHTVTGESACVSPANFDAEIGRQIARENAVQKIWPLEGYALRERLATEEAVGRPPNAYANVLGAR